MASNRLLIEMTATLSVSRGKEYAYRKIEKTEEYVYLYKLIQE